MGADGEARLLRAGDLTPGHHFPLGTYAVTEEEIVAFARRWDPLWFHVDPERAASGPFGEVIASGGHSLAIMIKLGSEGVMTKLDLIVGSSMRDVELKRPVRPGQVLTGNATVIDQEAGREGRAKVWIRFTLQSGDDEEVLSMVGAVLVRT